MIFDNMHVLPTWPATDMCRCSTCEWIGPIDKAILVADSEGWEYPTYYYHMCPVCEDGGYIEDYWSSIEALAEHALCEIHHMTDNALFALGLQEIEVPVLLTGYTE